MQITFVCSRLVRTDPRQDLFVHRHNSSPRTVSRNLRYLYELSNMHGIPRLVSVILGFMAAVDWQASLDPTSRCALRTAPAELSSCAPFYSAHRFLKLRTLIRCPPRNTRKRLAEKREQDVWSSNCSFTTAPACSEHIGGNNWKNLIHPMILTTHTGCISALYPKD